MVDLGDSYPIRSIKIFNREDCAYERAKGLTVQLSSDSKEWTTIAEINYSFGGYIKALKRLCPTFLAYIATFFLSEKLIFS